MSDQKKPVLVTGGAGYVGSHVAKALAGAGYLPVSYDNLSKGFAHAVKWGPLITADLHDQAALRQVFLDYQFFGVIHLAAFTDVGESVKRPDKYLRNNVDGSKCLISEMVKANVKNIVFSSTCSIYGETNLSKISETVSPDPSNPYAQSKWAVEQLLGEAKASAGIQSICLRYFNAAGADPDGEIGENHDPETHLIPLVLQTAAGLRPVMEVFGDDYPTPDGTAVRDYVHVSDLAVAHVTALDRLRNGAGSAAFNLANGTEHSVREVIETARRVTGREIPVRIVGRRAGDSALLVGDASRARHALNWLPTRSNLSLQITDAWCWLTRNNNP